MTDCPYEQRHGRPCHVCRSPKDGARPEDAPTHAGHLELVEAIDRIATAQLYADRGLYLLGVEVRDLPQADRLALDRWAAGPAPLDEPFVTRAHRAGPVRHGEPPLQACTRCHVVLQDHAALLEDGAYPVGAYVGLDCDGRPVDEKGPHA